MLRRSLIFLSAFIFVASVLFPSTQRILALTTERYFSSSSFKVADQQMLKNIVVIGGSYVGLATANELTQVLPATHRVIVVEKNSHFGHLFAYPRFAVTSKFEHKAFIPYTTTLTLPHAIVRGAATSIQPGVVSIDRPVLLPDSTTPVTEIPFDYVVLATGTKLAPPGTMPGEEKSEGVAFFQKYQNDVKRADEIVILGGGAVGVQLASDIAVLYPTKNVTLVHSRPQLMPRFHSGLHDLIMIRFQELKIKTVLGSRAVIPSAGLEGAKSVTLENGTTLHGDLIMMSTGQTPLSEPLRSMAPGSIKASGFISVKPTFQVDGTEAGLDRVFALGDIADSGAPKAARPAMIQAAVVAKNIATLIDGKTDFQTYKPDPAAIHMTLGIVESVVFRNPPTDESGAYIGEPTLFWKDDGKEDMGIDGVWARRAPTVTDQHL